MAASGSGTQLDPYVVDNWDDLVTCCGEDDKYTVLKLVLGPTQDTTVQRGKVYYTTGDPATAQIVANPVQSSLSTYYENTFVLDLNNEYPEGVPAISGTTVVLRLKGNFDGRGGTIRNIYHQATVNNTKLISFEGDASMVNTDVLNTYFVGISGAVVVTNVDSQGGTQRIRCCRFSGVMYNASFYLKSRNYDLYFERDAFVFSGDAGSCSLFRGDGTTLYPAVPVATNTLFEFSFKTYNTTIMDKLYYNASNCTFRIFIGSTTVGQLLTYFKQANSVVFEYTIENSTPSISLVIQECQVPCLFATAGVENCSLSGVPASCIQANAAQMQNADWLVTHGFPIGRLT